MKFIENLKFGKDGLIPAIVQDAQNNEVLMLLEQIKKVSLEKRREFR